VAQTLREHGIESVQALKGGWEAWKQAGYPVEPKE
jgi:rhodanese-related sulfurtransferase